MANFRVKKLPPIKLTDLLKKRKTNLKQFLGTYGIVSYTTLLQKCDSMGVSPPSEDEFKSCIGTEPISSPQEGVVVLDPPKLLKELTGEKIQVDESNDFHTVEVEVKVAQEEDVVEQPVAQEEESQVKSRKKRDKATV